MNEQRQSTSSITTSIIPKSFTTYPITTIPKNKYLSYLLMFLSTIAWVTGYIYSNQNNLHPVQTSMLRGFMIAIVSYCICRYKNIEIDIYTDVRLLGIRNIAFLVQSFVYALVQFYLPLGVLHTIATTGPLYVSVFQYIFDKKKPHIKQVIGMILTIFGVIFIANGRIFSKWIDPSYKFISDFKNYLTDDASTIAICCVLFNVVLIIWAYGVYATSAINLSPYLINLVFGTKLYLIASLIYPLYLTQNPTKNPPQKFYKGLIFTGIPFSIGQIVFVLSLIIAQDVGMTIMLSSITILIAYLISIFRYHEELNVFCVIGSGLVVLGLSRIVLHG